MTTIRVTNTTRGTTLGTRVRLADHAASRVRGFLFRPPPARGEGILLSPCKAVHMFGVRFPLDVVFISEQGEVVATYPRLAPWGRSKLHGSALHALELPPGTIRATGTAVGDDLSWTATGAESGEADTDSEATTAAAPELSAGAVPGGSTLDRPASPADRPVPAPATEAAATTDAEREATPELPADSDREPTRRQA